MRPASLRNLHLSTLPFLLVWTALCATAVSAAGPRTWDFSSKPSADGWRGDPRACQLVHEPGNEENVAYQVTATAPHHTRLILEGSGSTADFLISLRVKVLSWKGESPRIYVYARHGREGFRGLSVSPTQTSVMCYRGQDQPSSNLGSIGCGYTAKPAWIHLALACVGDYMAAKAWPEGAPEPQWLVEGTAPGQAHGETALGVWTSPRTPSQAVVLFDDVRFVPLDATDLAQWKLDPEPTLELSPAELPAAGGLVRPAAHKRLGLATCETAVAFHRQTGSLVNVVDRATGREFIARESKVPLFRLALTQPAAGSRRSLTARDFREVQVEPSGERKLLLTFSECEVPGLAVSVAVWIGDGEEIRMRIKAENASEWCVARIDFPVTKSPAVLGDDDRDDRMLLPWSGGAILPSPGKENPGRREAMYPGSAFAQFSALYDRTAGLYLSAEDPEGHVKALGFDAVRDASMAITLGHLFPELPAHDAVLPYDVVLRTFHGDWRDAADLYKAWAVDQPWCKTLLKNRDDVPQFLKEGAGFLPTGIRGGVSESGRFGANLEKLPDILDAYRQRTGLKHLAFVPYGWEKNGSWAGIDYLPAFPSNEAWIRVNRELHARGHRTAFLTSGYWWVVKRRKGATGGAEPGFDDTAEFERCRGMTVQNADGSTWTFDNYDLKIPSASWRGLSVTLCHGSAEAQSALKKIFLDVAALGVPLVSFDQEIGGGQRVPCYSPDHGHPPGYGAWMWTGFRDLCRQILDDGKPIQPELGLFMENDSELAIPYMATYWSRQFGEVDVAARGGRGVGLFSYLYHEYVTAIGAACVQGQGAHGTRPDAGLRCRVLANNLVRGLIQGPFMHDVPLEDADRWHAPVARAYFSYCRPYAHFPEYLMLGKTVRPPELSCGDVETWFYRVDGKNGKPAKKDGPPLAKVSMRLPAVIDGTFAAADGSQATFVVNTTPEAQEAAVKLPTGAAAVVYSADRKERSRIGESQGTVPLRLEPFGVRVVLAGRGAGD